MAAFNGGGALLDNNGVVEWSKGNMDINLTGVESDIKSSQNNQWFLIENHVYRGIEGIEWTLMSKSGEEVWHEGYWDTSAAANLNKDLPLNSDDEFDGIYTEHIVNHKLVERIEWSACINDSNSNSDGNDEFQSTINLMRKIDEFSNVILDTMYGSTLALGCPHVSYKSTELKKAPDQLFMFNRK